VGLEQSRQLLAHQDPGLIGEHVLLGAEGERNVGIMDNLNIHKSREVEELIRGTGARILYLPVYAPELNPIEMMWSVLKHFIRQLCRIGKYSMEQIVKTSLLLINPSSFRSWFAKCCYCTP
jgi:transposase